MAIKLGFIHKYIFSLSGYTIHIENVIGNDDDDESDDAIFCRQTKIYAPDSVFSRFVGNVLMS